MTTDTPHGSFHDQLREIIQDIDSEMPGYLAIESRETVQVIRAYLDHTFKRCANDPEEFTRSLQTLTFMMFLADREHALRGYKSPIPKAGFNVTTGTPAAVLALLEDIDGGIPDAS